MSDQIKINISPAVLAAYNRMGNFDQGALHARERYERMIVMALQCGISKEEVDVKLAVSTYQETHDWITGADRTNALRHHLVDVLSRMLASEGSL